LSVGGLAVPRSVHIGALVAYSVATLVLTLPLALRLGDSLVATDQSALDDAYLTVWIFGRGAHQLLTDPLHLFEGNIFYPFAHTLAFSEIILPGTLLYLPFAYATGNPVFAHNLVVLLSFPLNAMAMYFYALDWLAADRRKEDDAPAPHDPMRAAAAFVAGLVFAFCTYKMGELRHVQLLMAMFVPLTLWCLARFLRSGRWRDAAWTAICFALNALSSLYYGLFLVVGVAVCLAVDGAQRGWRYSRAHVRNGLLAAALSGALVLPFAWPYLGLEGNCQASETRDPRLFSARPASYAATPPAQWLYGSLTRKLYVASKGQPLFPGVAALTLAVCGLAASLRATSRAWVLPLSLVATGFVLSFGPVLLLDRAMTSAVPVPLPYRFLSALLPPLKCLGAPARFAVLSMAGLSLLSAKGLEAVLRRVGRRWAVVTAIATIVILSEYGVAPVRLANVVTAETLPEVYRVLARRPPGEPVVEMPMGAPTYGAQNRNAVYIYHSVYHQQPLVNGYSGFIPPEYYALVRDMQAFPSAAAVERLDRWGVEWIVVHANRYRDAAGLRRRLDQLSSIELVQDFGTIWLYRIRRTGA